MARYEHLPSYKEAFDLALYFEKTVRNMSRYDKYTLGADLTNLSRDVLRLIHRANSGEDRIATLKEVRSKVEELKASHSGIIAGAGNRGLRSAARLVFPCIAYCWRAFLPAPAPEAKESP